LDDGLASGAVRLRGRICGQMAHRIADQRDAWVAGQRARGNAQLREEIIAGDFVGSVPVGERKHAALGWSRLGSRRFRGRWRASFSERREQSGGNVAEFLQDIAVYEMLVPCESVLFMMLSRTHQTRA